MWSVLARLAKLHVTQSIAVAVTTLVLIWSLDKATVLFADRQIQDLIKDLPPSGQVMKSEPAFSSAIPQDQRGRMIDQFHTITSRLTHHLAVLRLFYRNYYGFVTTSAIVACVAAILLFYIGKEGWSSANSLLVTAFIISAAAAALYRSFPSAYRQEENIRDNKRLYRLYDSLGNEMLTYAITGENGKGEKKNPSEFMHYIDQRLSELNDIAIGFDTTVQPDYSKAFGKQ